MIIYLEITEPKLPALRIAIQSRACLPLRI